jgi:hypothetical protein
MLSELIDEYILLYQKLEIVRKAIEEEAAKLLKPGEKVERQGVVVEYSKGRGSYDWERLAYYLEPEEEQVKRHSKVVVDWKALCEEMKPSKDLLQKVYTPGEPKIAIKVKGGPA